MTRNIGLNISTANDDEWDRTYRTVSGVARHFGEHGQYVSVWSSATDEEVNDADEDGLKFDERTMLKVHAALTFAFKDQPDPEGLADRAIKQMVQDDILFRERVQ